ncbi:hypothetical protein EPN96_03480 [bacterium]|nr:MAG: hypothetical protein EPN96_03480 [bacterium]
MSFSPKVKEEVLAACGRHCCLCHKFCGIKVAVHHIKLESKGGDNSAENAIALCLDCHADMSSYDHQHPIGTKYSEAELRSHRDKWYDKVNRNIGIASVSETVDIDKKIFEKLVIVLPWRNCIYFLRKEFSAEADFKNEDTRQLRDFDYLCNNAAFEFIDPDLEGLRIALSKSVDKFIQLINSNTFHSNTFRAFLGNAPGPVCFYRVPEELKYEQPERYDKVVKEINAAADDVCDAYENLLKNAIRKLGVLPEGTLDF